MRRIVAGMLALAMAFPLTACSNPLSGDADEDAGITLDDKPVTLRFTFWGSDDRNKRTQEIIDLFQKAHPNITVQPEFKDWAGYWTNLASLEQAGNVPDVMQMDELYLSSYAAKETLLDLKKVEKFVKTDAFDESALETGLVGATAYAIPVGLSMYSMVVNTDLLTKYNIAMPNDATWSWADLKNLGMAISQASGGQVYGIQSWGFDTGGLNVWARQAGASLYDDKGNVTIPPKVLADFWQYLVDLEKAGAAPPAAGSIEAASGVVTKTFTGTNRAALGTWWNSQLTAVAKASGANLKLLRLPGESTSKSPGAYYKPSMFWTISAKSKHPGEAALLVDFLTNNEDAGKIMFTDRGIPANSKVRATIMGQLSPTDRATVEYLSMVKVGPTPRSTPKGASDCETILKRYTTEVLSGRSTPEQAAEAFIKELQAAIDAA